MLSHVVCSHMYQTDCYYVKINHAANIFSNLIMLVPINLATTSTTPTTPGLITTYPPPELLYSKTTDYHWPRFETEMTDRTGRYDPRENGLSDGPFGFGKSVKLKAGVEGEEDEVKNIKCFSSNYES